MLDQSWDFDGVGYHPIREDFGDLLASRAWSRALIVGSKVPDVIDRVTDVRLFTEPQTTLPEGIYWVGNLASCAVMLVSRGAPAQSPLRASSADADPPTALVNAAGWLEHWFASALSVPRPRFALHDDVITVSGGQDAVVRKRSFEAGSWYYDIRVDGRVRTLAEDNLDVLPVVDEPPSWIREEPAPAGRFASTLTRAKLEGGFTDTLFSFRATRTIFRPYQFRPVIKLLETGQSRLLVADEVGLGKTIEAGLLWTELEARRLAGTVLVICPSSLTVKWQREMDERFGFELRELDMRGLDEYLQRMETDRLPSRYQYVCSLERLRRWEGLERLGELRPHLDLVIVDEAHNMRNLGTKSYALGTLLSEWADALIFLSATPLNLRQSDLYNLLELLVPGEFDDIHVLEQRLEPNRILHRVAASLFDPEVANARRRAWLEEINRMAFGPAVTGRPEFDLLRDCFAHDEHLDAERVVQAKRLMRSLHALSAAVTRTRKVEVNETKALRDARSEVVTWTPAERAFYGAFYEWCRQRAQLANAPIGFAMQMPLRLAGSCLQMAKEQVLRWSPTVPPVVDEDDEDDQPQVSHRQPTIAPHAELVAAAQALKDVDSKYDSFEPLVSDLVGAGRRVLVFTFSRPTLAYLAQRLGSSVRVGVLHGGVTKEARHRLMADFRAGEYDVVLANRVASEGLDFEFCSAVINYDLPWNPMEVEQRIGRIDRIGQVEEKIYIVNFHTPETIEGTIIQRVMDRIGVFQDSIGELEPIIRSNLSKLNATIFDFDLSPQERQRRADEVLAAIEEGGRSRSEVEDASAYLMSSDGAEIEGLEEDLLDRGRYVGQPELALLIQDWAATAGAAAPKRTRNGKALTLRGNVTMAEHVAALARTGERSRHEVEALAARLREESELHLSLDQEDSREGGADLLTANHPLVRAALSVPGHRQARFACLTLRDASVPAGRYAVLISVARWRGLRPSREVWTQAASVDSWESLVPSVGDLVLAQLATGDFRDAEASSAADLARPVEHAMSSMLHRVAVEEARRRAENAALLETRRISIREVNERKRAQIQARITTLRQRDREGTIPLFEAQLAREQERLAGALSEIELAEACEMTLEHIAVCEVEVLDVRH